MTFMPSPQVIVAAVVLLFDSSLFIFLRLCVDDLVLDETGRMRGQAFENGVKLILRLMERGFKNVIQVP